MAAASLLVVFAGIIVTVLSGQRSGYSLDPMYHLSEVRRSVDHAQQSLSASTKRRVFKRSAVFRADDLLLHSVASYCDSFRANPSIMKYFEHKKANLSLGDRDMSGFTRFQPSGSLLDAMSKSGMHPKVLPVKVEVDEKEGFVWMVFHVAHSEDASISRTDPFDFQQTAIKMPEDSCPKGMIVSKARFRIKKSSVCRDPDATLNELISGFQITTANTSHYVTTVRLGLCEPKRPWDSKIRHKDIQMAPLYFLNQTDDVIVMNNNQDAQFNLRVNISKYQSLSVKLVLWDREKDTTMQFSSRVKVKYQHNYPNNFVIEKENENSNSSANKTAGSDRNRQLFSIDVLGSEIGSENQITARLRVVVKNIPKTESGKITFSHHEDASEWRDIVNGVTVDRSFHVMRQDTSPAQTGHPLYFKPTTRFLCHENVGDGHNREARFGANCTVRCQAFGKDIMSIFISKREPFKSPMMQSSYVLPHEAVAILNVGEASSSNEGEYECVVVDRKGRRKTQRIQLYTSLLTRITDFNDKHLAFDPPPYVAIIQCTAFGADDVEIAIFVGTNGSDEVRLDNDERFNTTVESNADNEITLTALIPWEEMQTPRTSLRCVAKGRRGESARLINLSKKFLNKYGVYPTVERWGDRFGATLHPNRTASVRCVASGKQPMQMWMSFKFPADVSPMNETRAGIKTLVEVSGSKMVLTYYDLPRSLVRGGSRDYYYCKAKNAYSDDQKQIYID